MIAFDPKICKKCKSVSCQKCIESKINCKKCYLPLSSNLVLFSNRELAVLNAFKLRCPNLHLGCTDISVYKDFFNHFYSCKYNKQEKEQLKPIKPQVDKGENKDSHMQIIHKTSKDKEVICPSCKKSILNTEFVSHAEGKCFEKIIQIAERHLHKENENEINTLAIQKKIEVDSFTDPSINDNSFFLTKKKLRPDDDQKHVNSFTVTEQNTQITGSQIKKEISLPNSLGNTLSCKYPSSISNIFGSIDSFRLNENSVYSDIESNQEDFIRKEESTDVLKWFNGKYEYIHNGDYNFTFFSTKRLEKDFIVSIKISKLKFNQCVAIGFSKELTKSKNYVLGMSKNEWCIRGDGKIIENNGVENNVLKEKFTLKSNDIIHFMRKSDRLEFEIDGKENNYSYNISSDLYFLVTLCSADDEVELLHN